MKCIYRKIIENTYSQITGNLLKTSEYFENCYENKCPAYKDEKCLKVDAELKNGQVVYKNVGRF
jgi:hypothetical protein